MEDGEIRIDSGDIGANIFQRIGASARTNQNGDAASGRTRKIALS